MDLNVVCVCGGLKLRNKIKTVKKCLNRNIDA